MCYEACLNDHCQEREYSRINRQLDATLLAPPSKLYILTVPQTDFEEVRCF
jgi:hypothetical protein